MLDEDTVLDVVDSFYSRGSVKGKDYTVEFVCFCFRNDIPLEEWLEELLKVRGQLGRTHKPSERNWYYIQTKKCINHIHNTQTTKKYPNNKKFDYHGRKQQKNIQTNSPKNRNHPSSVQKNKREIKIYDNFYELQQNNLTQHIEWG